MTTSTISSLFSSPTQEKHIKAAVKWLHEVCKSEGVRVKYIKEDYSFVGCFYPSQKLIEINMQVVEDSAFHLQTLLHETIHVMQLLHNEFRAMPLHNELIVGTVNQSVPLDTMKKFIMSGWGEEYGEDFEYLWLEEVGALLLQDCYYWFRQWYDKTYRDKGQLAA